MKAFGASANAKVYLSFWENLVNLFFGLRKNGVSLQNINEKLSTLFTKSNLILGLHGIGFGGLLIGRLAGLFASSVYFFFKIKKLLNS
jgi:hypothetical protein